MLCSQMQCEVSSRRSVTAQAVFLEEAAWSCMWRDELHRNRLMAEKLVPGPRTRQHIIQKWPVRCTLPGQAWVTTLSFSLWVATLSGDTNSAVQCCRIWFMSNNQTFIFYYDLSNSLELYTHTFNIYFFVKLWEKWAHSSKCWGAKRPNSAAHFKEKERIKRTKYGECAHAYASLVWLLLSLLFIKKSLQCFMLTIMSYNPREYDALNVNQKHPHSPFPSICSVSWSLRPDRPG